MLDLRGPQSFYNQIRHNDWPIKTVQYQQLWVIKIQTIIARKYATEDYM